MEPTIGTTDSTHFLERQRKRSGDLLWHCMHES